MKSISATAVCVALVLLGWVHPASGQNVTTGTITGVVSDEQGGVLPGATVTAVHEPTGTNYEAVTQGDGRFSLVNVRVGGPYQLVVALPGFRSETLNAVTVTLGETTELPVKLLLQSVTEVVQVTAESIPLFTASKAGTSDNVGTEVIETLPTINRSIRTLRASPRTSCSTPSTATPPPSRSPDATSATTTSRSTARSTTTCSASLPPRARREVRPKHSRSASTPSRNCSSSSRRTTCAREVSRVAASTRSRAAEPTRFAGLLSTCSAIRAWSATASTIDRSRPSTTSSSAERWAGRS